MLQQEGFGVVYESTPVVSEGNNETDYACAICHNLIYSSVTVRSGGKLYLSAILITCGLFLSMCVALALAICHYRKQLDSSIVSRRTILLPVYYYAIFGCCVYFFVEALLISIPIQDNAKSWIIAVLSAGQTGVVDVWILFWLMQPSTTSVKCKIVTLTCTAVTFSVRLICNTTMLGTQPDVSSLDSDSWRVNPCSFCMLFFSGGAEWLLLIFIPFFIFAVVDAQWLILRRLKLSYSFRPATKIWGTFLIITYTLNLIAAAIVLGNQSCGSCVGIIAVGLYIFGFSPIMYLTFIRDTRYCLGKGLAAESSEPLLAEATNARDALEVLLKQHNVPAINYAKIRFISKVGTGSFGEVYHAKWNGTAIAVKRLFGQDAVNEDLLHELSILCQLRHPNIVLLMGVSVDDSSKYCIITEFIDLGSLFSLIHENTKVELTVIQRDMLLTDTARGISYLHGLSPPVMHRDLKSPNVLVTSTLQAKIADFGVSREIRPSSSLMTMVGTPQWAAPEVLRGELYSEKADIYSFGVIMWETFTGETPFGDLGLMQVITNVGHRGAMLPVAPTLPRASLIMKCLSPSAEDRPSIPDIMAELEASPFSPSEVPSPVGLSPSSTTTTTTTTATSASSNPNPLFSSSGIGNSLNAAKMSTTSLRSLSSALGATIDLEPSHRTNIN
ncbi:Serine/threonine-protein kinase CTR1 [Pelomyxa schiedti]|nr:Serine/threonine-protein kinase CTR1 [Pelomyxa schiedti]